MVASIASFVDVCRFNPTAGGTTDWTVSSAVNGYQTPALAGAVTATTYRYRAESADLTQWEIGTGVYTVGTTTLTRGTVLFNSSGTGIGSGQSGAGTKINFTLVPQIAVVALAEDFLALTTGQIPGTPTNDSASAGNVGEVISASAALGSVGLTSATPANITSISLTAGDWEVYSTIYFTPAVATTISILQTSTNTTTATVDASPGNFGEFSGTAFNTGNNVISVSPGQPKTYKLAATTTVFLTCNQVFATSTMAAGGQIKAIRVR